MSSASETPELLRRTQEGEASALDELLCRHLDPLRAFVRLRCGDLIRARESTSDVVQSVCRDLLLGIDDFEYRGEGQFRSWLYQAALNKIREHERYFRRDKRDAVREVAIQNSGPGIERLYSWLTPSQEAMGRETAIRLEKAFDRLPEEYREVLTLSRVVGLSRAEVAQEMGRSLDSVRNLISRALAALSRILDRDAHI